MSERKLYVGMDLRPDVAKVAIMHIKSEEVENVLEKKTVIKLPPHNEEISDFIGCIFSKKSIVINKKKIEPVSAMAAFIRGILVELKQKTKEQIRKIAITLPVDDIEVFEVVYAALSKIGIEKDRAIVTGRRRVFSTFVMNQKKEIWINKVGMFDFNNDSLIYYQMQTDRMKTPALVEVVSQDYKEYMDLILDEKHDENEKNKLFENMVKGATHSKVLTSLFMTGEMFEKWPMEKAMKQLSVGRHLFMGQDIYTSGACYLAKAMDEARNKCIYIDGDTVVYDVMMSVYTDAKLRDVILIKAGVPWYQCQETFDIIPDRDDEISLICKNIITGEKTRHMIPLYGISDRVRRRIRLNVKLRFINKNKCIVTVRDKGFGNVAPTEHRIWEEAIILGNK